MRTQFKKDLIRSGFIHRPLPLYDEGCLEKVWAKRAVCEKSAIWDKNTKLLPLHDGEGMVDYEKTEDEEKSFRLIGKTVTRCWPKEMSPDGDCAFYGTVHAVFHFPGDNWENYNCLTFMVKPECAGARVVNLNAGIRNDGAIQIPDEYGREGSHVVNLINHEWNFCCWEFGGMARDAVTELDFDCRLNGRDTSTGDEVCFQIKDIYLEKTEKPEPDKGWMCQSGIAYSTSGYFKNGSKTAVTSLPEKNFQVLQADSGAIIYEGEAKSVVFRGEPCHVLDFTAVDKEGSYVLQAGNTRTGEFLINDDVYEEALWKVINFLFCERCGYPVPEKHGLCHQDVVARHDGKLISFSGGWHDAGDMSQQLIHTAEVTQALLETAEVVKLRKKNTSHADTGKDREDDDWNTLLYQRLIEEALWGLEFVLKSRFGDGYRATSAGLVRWTDGMIGNEDDVEVRGHNHAFENLLCGGVCAVAARILKETDGELAEKCLATAKEDYAFGMERFRKEGMELPIIWEHTYNSSKSQYYALIVWTASVIYECGGEASYAETAAEYGARLLDCQEIEGRADGFRGYFYRDESKKSIVHYSHQSREYMFVQALVKLCETQPEHADKPRWEEAVALCGEYIGHLMKYASPYRMIPAGLYHMSEAEDKETFELLHLLVTYEDQKEHYKKQLEQGVSLGDGYYVRNFPVWFSFRGNTAIHLSMGIAAAAAGRYRKDPELIQLAKEQLYWLSGKNPFQQSLIYGEGDRYLEQYAVMPGEMTGEMPVGIETDQDEDIPYWPHNNNATYKEVWTSSACRWLWTLAEIYRGEM